MMAGLPSEPTREALCAANILDLRDWLAAHFDDTACGLLAPLGWPLVEIGPDDEQACGVLILVRGVGTIRVTLAVESVH